MCKRVCEGGRNTLLSTRLLSTMSINLVIHRCMRERMSIGLRGGEGMIGVCSCDRCRVH